MNILLEQAGFKSSSFYADFEDKEPTETSTRWFFCGTKVGEYHDHHRYYRRVQSFS